jgi:uncharacterized RDD family membrane protein YckC
VSDLPSYPADAAEREAAAPPPDADRAYSSWGRRVVAYLLDSCILLIPIGIALAVVVAVAPEDDDDPVWAVLGIAYVLTLALPFVYFTYFHGKTGQTPGKRALGIRVVSDRTGGTIGYFPALGRYGITVIFSIFVFPLLLDYLWPLWDGKNQALHDKVVSSVVFRV